MQTITGSIEYGDVTDPSFVSGGIYTWILDDYVDCTDMCMILMMEQSM